MTTAQAAYPGYAVLPSPIPRGAADALTLVALDSAARLAGLFARHAAVAWGVPQAAGHAVRVTAELMARAVETTGITGPHRLTDSPPPFLGIRVSLLKHAVLVEVWDSDPASPLPAGASGLDRHLRAVSDICQRWNWYRPDTGGKVIWAEVAAGQLPHRKRRLPARNAGAVSFPEPVKPVTPQADLSVLGAVLDGLRRLDARGRDGANIYPARGAVP